MNELLDFYIFRPEHHALVAVTIPAILSLFIVSYRLACRALTASDAGLLMASLALSFLTGFWDDEGSYHGYPAYLMLVGMLAAWRKHLLRPDLLFAGTFLSTLIPDLYAAWWAYPLEDPSIARAFYYGVGMAGFGDGLFLYPLLAVLVALVFNWRLRSELDGAV